MRRGDRQEGVAPDNAREMDYREGTIDCAGAHEAAYRRGFHQGVNALLLLAREWAEAGGDLAVLLARADEVAYEMRFSKKRIPRYADQFTLAHKLRPPRRKRKS